MNPGGRIPRVAPQREAAQAPPQEAGAEGGAHYRPDPRGQHGGAKGGGYEGKGYQPHPQGGRGHHYHHGGRGGGRTWSTDSHAMQDLRVELAKSQARNEVLQELAGKQLGGGGATGFVPDAAPPYAYAEAVRVGGAPRVAETVKVEPAVAAQAAAPAKPSKKAAARARRIEGKLEQAAKGGPLPNAMQGPWQHISEQSCDFDIRGVSVKVSSTP